MNSNIFKVGLDIGSTTIKVVFLDTKGEIVYSDYKRHHADIPAALKEILINASEKLGNCKLQMVVTGSAGMGISEKYGIPFVQEVVAAANLIAKKYPDIKTLIDIGGEDTKMVFFHEGRVPDIRMNGSCAGGTGAFIDQMATLLNMEVSEMSKLATPDAQIYPIASRCGVFSKTDIQNLIARNVKRSSISASVFHAVAVQTITTLSRGTDPEPKVFFCGGPMAFIPALREAFIKLLGLKEGDYILSENAALIPAWGCSLTEVSENITYSIEDLIIHVSTKGKSLSSKSQHRLDALFENEADFEKWKKDKHQHFLEKTDIAHLEGNDCFLGIDSGSTTTKIVALDKHERVVFKYYARNGGNPLKAVATGLMVFVEQAREAGKQINIIGSSVTGYGEDLVKAAFNMDYGLVETIAHYTAAHKFNPKVSFILDIGGQDMKAIFVENGAINRLEINEACSSGCGSFIEGFAANLKYTAADFATLACSSTSPCDLGTRCTVFMNSKVKQFLREGAPVSDISAGLAYSVVKNCLYKVLKLKDVAELGENIVVQGGTMRNLAVVRALELLTKKDVLFTDMPELMGAFGGALYACRMEQRGESIAKKVSLEQLSMLNPHDIENFQCAGCENNCIINKFGFENGNTFFSGNKCEKIYSNKGGEHKKGENHYHFKYNTLVVKAKTEINTSLPVIGIPRALGIYENLPFWQTLLTECGFKTVLSGRSTFTLYEQGLGSVMSDNICFPAKLVHGHIIDLVHKKVNRIFMPYVVFEAKEDKNTANSFNCPIVSGYSDVVKSAMTTHEKHGIPVDAPTIVFNDDKLLKKACLEYFNQFGIKKNVVEQALAKAQQTQKEYYNKLYKNTKQILDSALAENKMVIMLVGRPYHTDPLVQHKISDMISSFGIDIISEDYVRESVDEHFSDVQAVMQWAYTNRILKAARYVANTNANIHFVQMTSFGCGPDAFIIDEVNEILKGKGKNLTLLKIDDVNNIGSLRLRIRSLIESLKFAQAEREFISREPKSTPLFQFEDRRRTILAPFFSEFYSPIVPHIFKQLGYNVVTMPPSDDLSSEYGLKYSNNEVCFPATLMVGDIIKALYSGKYKSSDIAILMTQTGGQCRATNYIALIKKAMLSAGYDDVPVLSLASGNSIYNQQPGFELKWRKIMVFTTVAMLYADSISKMYYATAPREKIKDGAAFLRDKYIDAVIPFAQKNDSKSLYKLLKSAVAEFNEMTLDKYDVPRVGIVGEIFVKYNSFGNKNVVNWLVGQNVEVVVPSLINFFIQYFANYRINIKQNIEQPGTSKWIVDLIYMLVNRYMKKIDAIASEYKFHRPFSNIYEDAEKASHVVNLAAQFGEGWLIPAEIANFAEEGVMNAVSLQPFGCIANHVIAKGVEKKMKTLFPNMNLLFLDLDSGTSDVNILNRLHFMIKNATEIATDEPLKDHEEKRKKLIEQEFSI